jgi:transposase-like protein
MQENIRSKSRKETPWTGKPDATPLQAFIDTCNQNNYFRRHPDNAETGESQFINSYQLTSCRWCGSGHIKAYGHTSLGIRRWKCNDCGRTFTPITGTIFDSRKIPLSEWLDFMLSVFGYGSFRLVSKSNRNAYNTTRYWMDKMFLVLRRCQQGVVLSGKIELDETYYKVRQPDIERRPDGKEYRGLSRNQICISIACDSRHVVCFEEGTGKPKKQKVYDLFREHIQPGCRLVHDMERAHSLLVEELHLESTTYNSKVIKLLPDKENPLNDVNQYCRLLQLFLGSHSGFIRDGIQDYLNLFCFISNPPEDKFEKVEKFMRWAMLFPDLCRYRG